jgi:hypothetical protein
MSGSAAKLYHYSRQFVNSRKLIKKSFSLQSLKAIVTTDMDHRAQTGRFLSASGSAAEVKEESAADKCAVRPGPQV